MARLEAVEGGRRGSEGHDVRGWESVAAGIQAELAAAKTAIQPSGWLRGVCAWWSGAAITKAWESVHVAETALLGLESEEDVAIVVPRLLGWIERTMDQGPRREAHEAALKKRSPSRVEVRAALTDVTEANGNRYANLRAFRNNLILVMVVLLATLVGLAGWHALNPHFLSLCTDSTGGKLTNCLGGKGSEPDGADVALVAAMGALGGLLAIAFSFSETDVAPTRYDPKTWQAFLKPVTGAATALIAVLLLQSGLLLKPVSETQSMFLAYAVIFGFSQQLLTRFVDKQADSLITPDGGKTSE